MCLYTLCVVIGWYIHDLQIQSIRLLLNHLSHGGFSIWHLGFICFWKYIVFDVCGLRSPSFEFSSVLYITPTDTSSMQDLILQGLQQKLQKSRCDKNTWQVEYNYILQPPKYLLLFVNRFRYTNNNAFCHDVGEISDLIQSEALNLVMWRVRVMQPTTRLLGDKVVVGTSYVQENGSMKCH